MKKNYLIWLLLLVSVFSFFSIVKAYGGISNVTNSGVYDLQYAPSCTIFYFTASPNPRSNDPANPTVLSWATGGCSGFTEIVWPMYPGGNIYDNQGPVPAYGTAVANGTGIYCIWGFNVNSPDNPEAQACVNILPPPTATINIVNSCTVNNVKAGIWTRGASTGTDDATLTVSPAAGGSNYSVSFAAPSGYTGSVDPAGSVNLGPGGTATFTTSCVPTPPDVQLTLDASPNPYSCSAGTTISWAVQNATSCTASGDWSGTKTATDGTHTETVYPTGTSSYGLSCTGNGAPATAQPVSVSAPSPSCPAGPIITVTASPNPINAGDATAVSWSNNNSSLTADKRLVSCSAISWANNSTALSGTQSVTPLTSTTYTVTCVDGSGTAFSGHVDVSVNVGPSASVALTADKANTTSGSSVVLTWTTGNTPTSCTASGGWTGAKATTGGTATVNPTVTTTYTLTCSNANGSGSSSQTVTIGLAPTVSLSSSPTSINSGGSSTLTWTTGNTPTSCTASGGWTGSKTTTGGNTSVSPTTSTTYALSCSNAFGTSNTAQATVTVGTTPPTPTITVSASPATINSGQSSTITWSTLDATSCSAPWTQSSATSGTQIVSPTVTTTYTLTCTGSGGSNSGSAVVTISGTGGTFDFSLSGNSPLIVAKDGTDVLTAKTITITKIAGTAKPVSLQVVTPLSNIGISAFITNSSTCTPNPSCTLDIQFTIPQTASTVTNFPITIRGTSN